MNILEVIRARILIEFPHISEEEMRERIAIAMKLLRTVK